MLTADVNENGLLGGQELAKSGINQNESSITDIRKQVMK
jgi:hypothetical protein